MLMHDATEGTPSNPAIVLDVAHSDNIHAQAFLLDTWNQHYTQLSPGRFLGGVTSLHSTGIRVFAERMNRAVLQKGDVGGRRLGFGIATRVAGKCRICGEAANVGDLLVFSGEAGFEFLSPDEFEFYGIEVKAESSEDSQFAALVQVLEDRLRGMRRATRLRFHHAASLVRSFRSVLLLFEEGSVLQVTDPTVRALQRQMVGSVIDCLDAAVPPEENSRAARNHWAIVRAIREGVLEHPDCPLSVAELSMRLDVSRRTLQNAVNSTLDMNPVTLLRALRLSEARREIVAAASITEVATRWGFWHFGYFARDYRAMFGELPSQTRARARGEASRLH
jgi:AraC family transcriptional regulator, ethanolamine operon transcriptional activator